jgi:hypothetical protein
METKSINNYSDLVLRIHDLRWEVSIKEEKLQESFAELARAVNPVSIAKESLFVLAEDENAQTNLTVAGIRMAIKLICNKLFGKDNNVHELISSVFIPNIPISFFNEKIAKIANGIGNFLSEEKG